MRVSGNLAGAERANLIGHVLASGGRGPHEVDLLALDGPTGDEAIVIGHQFSGGKRFNFAQEV